MPPAPNPIFDFLVQHLSPGVIMFLLGAWGSKKYFSNKGNQNGNGKSSNGGKNNHLSIEALQKENRLTTEKLEAQIKERVTEVMCGERNRRTGDNFKRLNEESKMHFATAKETKDLLHSFDKKMDRLIDHHKIEHKEELS
jgi:hypothetical protein